MEGREEGWKEEIGREEEMGKERGREERKEEEGRGQGDWVHHYLTSCSEWGFGLCHCL